MKRYNIFGIDEEGYEEDPEVVSCHDGPWCDAEEALAEIAKRDSRLAELEAHLWGLERAVVAARGDLEALALDGHAEDMDCISELARIGRKIEEGRGADIGNRAHRTQNGGEG